jgi:hypothetical protein
MNSRGSINAKLEGIFQQVRDGKPPEPTPFVRVMTSIEKIKKTKYTSYVRAGKFYYDLEVVTERYHRKFLARIWREDEEKMSYDEIMALYILLQAQDFAPFQAAQKREPPAADMEDRAEQLENIQRLYARNKLLGMRDNPHRVERVIVTQPPTKKSIVYFAYEIVQGA